MEDHQPARAAPGHTRDRALLGWIANRARQQREAVAALQKFGGFVHYDWEFVDGRVKVPRGNSIWKPTWGTLTPGSKPWAPTG